MRFLNLVAVPHPAGNRIDVTLGASKPDAVSGRARGAS